MTPEVGKMEAKKYRIGRKNILAHELIGLEVKVMDSSDRGRKGFSGRVVDETKHTLRIESAAGEKVVPKKECVFGFKTPEGVVEVEGIRLCHRPEDRTKEYWRKAA